jgi:hypothetical protein
MPPNKVIVISSDSETYDDETYDDESYDDEPSDNKSSDDESSDEQQKSGPRCSPASLSISRTTPSTKLSRLANRASACQPGQESAPNHTRRNNTALVTDVTFLEHKAARECQRDPRLFTELCGTASNADDSKCLSQDERDTRRFRHYVQDPRRAAYNQETRQKSDGSYGSASHDHRGDGDQRSGSAHRHLPVSEETGEPTKNDPVRLLHFQERRASPLVVPDHQSTSEPKPADAELCFQYRSPPSTASKQGGNTAPAR